MSTWSTPAPWHSVSATGGNGAVMRFSFVRHPLAPVMNRAVHSFCAALSPETTRHYEGTVRNFLFYFRNHHPDVKRLDQLQRDPHILGWMAHLQARTPPLGTASYINLLIALRSVLNELAWTQQLPQLAHMLRREDVPGLRKDSPERSPPSRTSSFRRVPAPQ